MQLESHARRHQEFLIWFADRYKPAFFPPVKEGQSLVHRVFNQRAVLKKLLLAYKPDCYWCGKQVDPNSFDLINDEKDSLLLHHVDEDRSHNENSNLEVCHKDCHQTMHKLSTKLVLPAQIVREMAVISRQKKEQVHA